DFRIDNNVNGEVLGNSVEVEVETGDEVEFGNGTGGSSIEGAFQLGQDEHNNQDSAEREMASSVNGEEPYVGQEFDSESAAHAFYNAYAARVGFVIRVSKLSRSRRDGSAIGRALVCNKEGYRSADRREKVVRQRAETRVGCRAMILVRKINSGKWVVTKFVSEHTHALTPGKCRRDLIYDQFPNEHDKIRELTQQLATEKKRAASYKRHLEMIFQHIEEHNEGLAKKVQHIVDSVKDLESKEQRKHT
uniref:FAR1 domain-containing protein n=2 Tax=Kalanchoe fedtschenkoi TaxID=63787 RepID=A0A7N0TUL7_KALFE